ncbi:Hypothetical predicted protein [Lecanosticta acicola]|uniref:Uncharacterized protein n=1 Tax=Lecanosticta acicola TaxID=111012 RepID=A0AAI8YSM7_9PEZI|nr:Hypothetical predicted protein [Lecanosticta acicola]
MRFTTALIAAVGADLAAATTSAHQKATSTISTATNAGIDARGLIHHQHTHTHTPRALANVEVHVTEDDVTEAFNADKPDKAKEFDAADKWVTVTKTAGVEERGSDWSTNNGIWHPPKTTTTATPLPSSTRTKIPFHSQPAFRSAWSEHHRTWDPVYMTTSTEAADASETI